MPWMSQLPGAAKAVRFHELRKPNAVPARGHPGSVVPHHDGVAAFEHTDKYARMKGAWIG